MNIKWIAAAVITAGLAVPAFGQIGIYIGNAPPPMRYEARPPMPGEGYAWVDGYWNWGGNRYAWVPGRWNRPPYPGAYWSHPHYDHYSNGWQMQQGHWDHEDHRDHHYDNHHDDHHDDHGHH